MIWKKAEIRIIIWMVVLIKNGMQIFSYILAMIYQRPFSQARSIQQGTKGLLEWSQLHPPNISWFCNDYFPRALHWSLLGWSLSIHKNCLTCLYSIFKTLPIWFLSYILFLFVTISTPDTCIVTSCIFKHTKSSKLFLVSNKSSL